MGVYLSFSAARYVPDFAHENFFISNAPTDSGIHSSYVSILLKGVAKHATDLAAPAWYTNSFYLGSSLSKLTRDHLFDPFVVMADLLRMQAIVAAYPDDFPVMHWLSVGNQAGNKCIGSLSSLNIYHEGEPSRVFGGWDKVQLRPGYPLVSSRPPIDLTNQTSFKCQLQSVNPIELDGLEVTVYIERESFASMMAQEFESAFSVCRWAKFNACMVFPHWS
jgi:hypothetical protein